MTVAELARAVALERDTTRTVGVRYDPGHAVVGGAPLVPIVSAIGGFDWDRGSFILTPQRALGIVGADFEKVKQGARTTSETLAYILMALKSRGLDDTGKVSAIRSHINAYMKKEGRPEIKV